MKKSLTKRALSLVLCVVMLVSCWVFTAPSANAVSTGPSSTYGSLAVHTGTSQPADKKGVGQYRVRLLFHETNSFDKSVHDNLAYKAGLVYTTSTTSDGKRNLTGLAGMNDYSKDNGNYWCEYAKIEYKTLNGTGDTGAVWFNLGDKDDHGRSDIISGNGQDYGYYPYDEGVLINGFPTSFTTRFVDSSSEKTGVWPFQSQRVVGYEVYLQIAVYNSDGTYSWPQGTDTSNGTLGIGGWNDRYAGGIASATATANSTGSAIEIKKTATVSNTYYPQASTSRYANNGNGVTAVSTVPAVSYGTGTIYCPKTSDAALTTSNKSNLSFTSPKDQYGVTMAANITTKLSRDDKSATDFTQSGLTTATTYTANIAGTTSLQYVSPTVTWPQKTGTSLSRTLTDTSRLYVYDAQYTVKFKDYTGKIVQNGNNGDYTQTISYGSDATVPEASTYKNYYNDDNHYTFNTWDPSNTNVTSDRTCVPQYTETAHTMVNDNTIQGYVAATCTEDGVQTKKCSGCDYTTANTTIPALGHTFKLAQTEAEDGQQGYIYYECERVESCGKYCYASYDAQTGEYSKVNENNPVNYSAITSDPQTANKIPAPLFNDRVTSEKIYQRFDYSKRQASFKYMSGEEIGKQTVRFAGSVKIPEGIGYDNTQEDNQIIDFGFVYTQESFILDENDKPDPDKLVFCEDDEFYDSERKTNYDNPSKAGYRVYKMSLAENNPSISNIKYWTGCTLQESGNVTGYDYITFNLVVNVNAKNWHKNYVCRPYIVYNFRGKVYTVYDAGASNGETKYFSRSIASLTNDIMKSDMLFNVDTPVYYDSQEFSLEDFMRSIFIDKGYDYDDYCSFAQRYINDKDYVETRIIDHYLETYDESDEERAGTVSLFENGVGWLSSTDAYNILHDENSDIMYLFSIV